MRMPGSACARLKSHAGTAHACRIGRLKKRIDSYGASEPLWRSFRGRLRASSFDFHFSELLQVNFISLSPKPLGLGPSSIGPPIASKIMHWSRAAFVHCAVALASQLRKIVLLLVKDDDVAHVVSLLILTLQRARVCLSIRGNHTGYSHRDLAALFLYGLHRVGINALDRYHVSPRNSDSRVVLSVEFCVELYMHRVPISVRSVGLNLVAVPA